MAETSPEHDPIAPGEEEQGGGRVSRRRFVLGAASAAGLWGLAGGAAGPLGLGCAGRTGTPTAGRAREVRDVAQAALARAHAWLWSAQVDDGRFASARYGLLSSGQSLTPFALDSLLAAPASLLASRGESIARAVGAMLRLRGEDGCLGFREPGPDYPCYATGLLLSCLGAARPPGWRRQARSSVDWLRDQQFRAAEGWAGHPAQGGWGMGSRVRLRPPHAGHVDLSMTRRVLLGLRAVGLPPDDPALLESRDFVLRCQTDDGSFVYSPVEQALNKGLRTPDGSPRGYGSATADGVLCLLALDAGEPSRACTRGWRWLCDHHRVDRNPGLDGGPMEPFAEAMRGYYRAGAARCFAALDGPPDWRDRLVRRLAAEQQPDGSFRGTNGLQKEDDPIVATGFAVQALSATLSPRVDARAGTPGSPG